MRDGKITLILPRQIGDAFVMKDAPVGRIARVSQRGGLGLTHQPCWAGVTPLPLMRDDGSMSRSEAGEGTAAVGGLSAGLRPGSASSATAHGRGSPIPRRASDRRGAGAPPGCGRQNAATTMVTAKWVSPSGRAPACPAWRCDSSTISSRVGVKALGQLVADRVGDGHGSGTSKLASVGRAPRRRRESRPRSSTT